ncbi:MAG: DinB family protein [Thermaerobacter sp.]|nr:damage-inducible protein DinB [Bacillota bacterium]
MGHPVLSLYEYHVWANEKVFDHLRTLPEGVYDRQLTSVFPSVAETLGHVYVVDSLWLSTMQGDTTEETFAVIQKARGEVQGAGLDRMRELFAAVAAEYRSFLRQQDDLDRPVVPHHPRYGPLETRLSELVRHVVNHGTYHRGMITAMLRQQGHPGVPTDYVFFLLERWRGGEDAGRP